MRTRLRNEQATASSRLKAHVLVKLTALERVTGAAARHGRPDAQVRGCQHTAVESVDSDRSLAMQAERLPYDTKPPCRRLREAAIYYTGDDPLEPWLRCESTLQVATASASCWPSALAIRGQGCHGSPQQRSLNSCTVSHMQSLHMVVAE